MRITRSSRILALAILFLAMMTAMLPGTISHADNNPAAVAGLGDVYLPLVTAPDNSIHVATVLTPFDANTSDLNGPSSWATNYGKTPEIIVASDGNMLHILVQDYDPATPGRRCCCAWNPLPLAIKLLKHSPICPCSTA